MAVGCAVAAAVVGSSPAASAAYAPSAAAPRPAQLAAFLTSYDFGTVVEGTTTASVAVKFANVGDVDSGTLAVQLGGADPTAFRIDGTTCLGPLAAESVCEVDVHFRVGQIGSWSAVLSVGGTPGGTAQTTLTGSTGDAQLAVSGSVPGFGAVLIGGTSAAQTVTFVNDGIAPSGPVAVEVGGVNGPEFVKTATTCGPALPIGGTCTATVVFTPKAAGVRTATLTAHAGPGGTAVATLTGTGLTPARLAITPAAYDFGFVPAGGDSGQRMFEITNVGQVASGPLQVTIDVGSPVEFYGGTDCRGVALAPGASCMALVSFEPLDVRPGTYQGRLTATASPGGTATSALQGEVPTPAAIAISPATAAFGSVAVGSSSAPQTFTVTNSGQMSVDPFSVFLSGKYAGDFHIDATDCTPYLLGGGSCTATVRFTPSGVGARSALLFGQLNGSAGAVLTGTGV